MQDHIGNVVLCGLTPGTMRNKVASHHVAIYLKFLPDLNKHGISNPDRHLRAPEADVVLAIGTPVMEIPACLECRLRAGVAHLWWRLAQLLTPSHEQWPLQPLPTEPGLIPIAVCGVGADRIHNPHSLRLTLGLRGSSQGATKASPLLSYKTRSGINTWKAIPHGRASKLNLGQLFTVTTPIRLRQCCINSRNKYHTQMLGPRKITITIQLWFYGHILVEMETKIPTYLLW